MKLQPPRRTLFRSCALMFSTLALTLGGSVHAQQNIALTASDDVVKLDTAEVSIPVTVRSHRTGGLIGTLSREDFAVYEDGVKQDVVFFAREHVPVSVVLLIDTSSSVRGELENIKEAAYNFLQALEPQDQVSIIGFADDVTLIQDWTRSKRDLTLSLERLKSGKFTAFYDALYLAAREQLDGVKGRKAIIVLSDGVDNRASSTSWDEAYDAIIRSEATVYIVSKTAILRASIQRELLTYDHAGSLFTNAATSDAQYARQLKQVLQVLDDSERDLTRIAADTGARIYLPMTMYDLRDAYSQVATELKSQYIINYVPTNSRRDGSFRRVKVKALNPEYRAFSRGGYYAQTEAPPKLNVPTRQ